MSSSIQLKRPRGLGDVQVTVPDPPKFAALMNKARLAAAYEMQTDGSTLER